MKGFPQHGDSEIAETIPISYQRLPSTKQLSWNSSNIIIFQTIYPLKQKRDGGGRQLGYTENPKSFHLDEKKAQH